MRRKFAARFALSGLWLTGAFGLTVLAPTARAQSDSGSGGWNDDRTRALVELATRRRAEQLADTGLVDYRANARGYLTFLVSMGSGFLEAPKVVKTDQLAVEVYWHAPNLSKQRIIGRRDTLLLPTDIQYHRDHLGIVQNNFPDVIRIGDGGDEVRDVPHPLSAIGLTQYDFQLSRDSVRIRLPDRVITLLEVKVRPKNDREPRVIGAIYIDPTAGQVVRMAFNFTRAAFIDKELEDLALVLENRLVGGRFWLPSRQEIEIRRTGTWLDYPVRGIIRGRWEIEDYQFNLATPTQTFAGDEIVVAPPDQLAKYPWPGTIMDSLPPDVRATVDPNIKAVLDEARGLVRAQALQRVQAVRLSAPHASDFARVNRVEGLAVGAGVKTRLLSTVSFTGRARYGIDDHAWKGLTDIGWENGSGRSVGVFATRDLVDVGDQAERSTAVNSLAAQEFGSDLTDPYLLDAVGIRAGWEQSGFNWAAAVTWESQKTALTHASPATGHFEPTPAIVPLNGRRASFTITSPAAPWRGPGELAMQVRLSAFVGDSAIFGGPSGWTAAGTHTSFLAETRSPVGSSTLDVREQFGMIAGTHPPLQELVLFGGPISAPGFALHSIAGTIGSATRVEVQTPIPFIPIPLGRFGTVPGWARLAPYFSVAAVGGEVVCTPTAGTRCPTLTHGWYPSAGVGLLTFFDVLRFDLARGLVDRRVALAQPGGAVVSVKGGWIFSVDVVRDFWSIL